MITLLIGNENFLSRLLSFFPFTLGEVHFYDRVKEIFKDFCFKDCFSNHLLKTMFINC